MSFCGFSSAFAGSYFWFNGDSYIGTEDTQMNDGSSLKSSYRISKSKSVGEIECNTTITDKGVAVVDVPIAVYQEPLGTTPDISLVYNSLSVTGCMGCGWSCSAMSCISWVSRNYYYDGYVEASNEISNDALSLDGVRLVKVREGDGMNYYQSVVGNVSVIAYVGGGGDGGYDHYDVRYPDGSVALYEPYRGMAYRTKYTNRFGRDINYLYEGVSGHWRLSCITYGKESQCSVRFRYRKLDEADTKVVYWAGAEIKYDYLLSGIETFYRNKLLRSYKMTYQMKDNMFFLSEIGCESGEEVYNPLHFSYANNNNAEGYSVVQIKDIQLEFLSSSKYRLVRGNFDYGNDNDGVVIFSNKYPYLWNNLSGGNTTGFNDNDSVKILSSINDGKKASLLNLETGKGFVEVLTAPLDDENGDEIIKINDVKSQKGKRYEDLIIVSVYHVDGGQVKLKYSREYKFYTADEFDFVAKKGSKQRYPKEFFIGDFNGDGRNELLVLSAGISPGCLLVDIERDVVLYKNAKEVVVPITKNIPDKFFKKLKKEPLEETIYKHYEKKYDISDKVFACDYNCDGKTEILVLGRLGKTSLYSFCDREGGMECQLLWCNKDVKFEHDNRKFFLGEFNGDGLPDIMISPKRDSGSKTWTIYANTGYSEFKKYSLDLCEYKMYDVFYIHDVNFDCQFDVIKQTKGCLDVNFVSNFKPNGNCNIPIGDNACVVPTDISHGNIWYSILTLMPQDKGESCVAHEYSYKDNSYNRNMLSSIVNSFGMITSLKYGCLNDEYPELYSTGHKSLFPYRDYKGKMCVCSNMRMSYNDVKIHDFRYKYEGAVSHCQGLGFCGFTKMCMIDDVTGDSCVKNFDPYSYSVLTSLDERCGREEYSYSIDVKPNKIRSVNMTEKMTYHKDVDTSVKNSFSYDEYGNVLSEICDFYDTTNYTYKNFTYRNVDDENNYILGLPCNMKEKNVSGNKSHVMEHEMSYENNLLVRDERKINDSLTSAKCYYYDDNLVTCEEESRFSGPKFCKRYFYDSEGRKISAVNELNEKETYDYNSKGLQCIIHDKYDNKTSVEYDAFGRITKEKYPDGTEKNIELQWTDGEANSVYKKIVKCSGKKTIVSFYDICGNVVRTSETCFDNSILSVDKRYDKRNRLIKVSNPYKGSEPTRWTSYEYDDFDRLVKVVYPSGKTDKYEYFGLVSEIVKDGRKIRKEYDSVGRLVSVTDDAGKITYSYCADGELKCVTNNDEKIVTYDYDNYGRRVSMSDLCAGNTRIKYDECGNVESTVDAKGREIKYFYDECNQLLRKEYAGGPVYTYSYDSFNRLDSVFNCGSVEQVYSYDELGRIVGKKYYAQDGRSFEKKYSYLNGNVCGVDYFLDGDTIIGEKYSYLNGVVSSIDLSDGTNIYKRRQEDGSGHLTKYQCGIIENQIQYGLLDKATSLFSRTCNGKILMSYVYEYDDTIGNVICREDHKNALSELFEYDNMNRLRKYGEDRSEYDDYGNIKWKSHVGNYEYGNFDKPYFVTSVEDKEGLLSQQCVLRTDASGHISKITGDNGVVTFAYDSECFRKSMCFTDSHDDGNSFDKFYFGHQFERKVGRNEVDELLYLGGDEYSAKAVLKRQDGGKWTLYYVLRDHLGSVISVVDVNGNIVQELSYDAWGNMRDPKTWEAFEDNEPDLFLERGYCGHEHLQMFRFVNMNARLYDPVLGRFLSPDPFVSSSDCSWSFNRYAYCMDNPLSYTDKDGNNPLVIIAAAALISGGFNLAANWDNVHNFMDGLSYFAAGAAVGAGNAAVAMYCPAAFVGAIPGFVSGACMGGVSGFLLNGLNNTISSRGFFENGYNAMLQGLAYGGSVGAATGALQAHSLGLNVFTGKPTMIPVPESVASGLSGQLDDLSNCEIKPAKINGLNISNDITASSSRLPENWSELTPYQKGQWGVHQAIEDLHLGEQPYATEVSFSVEGTTYRADVIYQDKSGMLHVVEVKAGPNAGFTPNQKIAITAMQERHVSINPFGGKAWDYYKFDVPVNVTNYSFDLIIIK